MHMWYRVNCLPYHPFFGCSGPRWSCKSATELPPVQHSHWTPLLGTVTCFASMGQSLFCPFEWWNGVLHCYISTSYDYHVTICNFINICSFDMFWSSAIWHANSASSVRRPWCSDFFKLARFASHKHTAASHQHRTGNRSFFHRNIILPMGDFWLRNHMRHFWNCMGIIWYCK